MQSYKTKFDQDGYVIIRDFITADDCEKLKARAEFLLEQFDPTSIKTVFSTHDQRHAQDQYFLESGNDIRFFFEAGALTEAGDLKVEKSKSINKIGHALHTMDPIFQQLTQAEPIQQLLQDLTIVDPQFLQSMYIFKQPYIGGEVTCHQDGTYLHSAKSSVVGLWFAIEDATIENGCLWAIPGGHRSPLKSRFIRHQNRMTTEIYDDTPWSLDQMIPLDVPRGSVIVLHSQLPHMSKENTSPHSRHAYALHLMDGEDDFLASNWLQR